VRIGAGCAVVIALACLLPFADASAQEQYRLRQLTNDPARTGFRRGLRTVGTFLFSRYGKDAAPEKTGLWIVSPEGGEPRQLTAVIAEHPDWSPDGRYIVFDGDFGNRIQLVSAAGGLPSALFRTRSR